VKQREWIDVSRPLRSGMEVFPGDLPAEIRQVEEYGCRVTSLSMSAHTGTHMDAPLHFIAGGASIDEIPMDVCIGPARVTTSLEPVCERMLFKGSRGLRAEDARFLATHGVKLIGVDALSVDIMGDWDFPVHHILLESGIWIAESLDLSLVEPGDYDLICLPLRIAGADGAPARVLLRPK
jgi:arylformamidase